MKHTHITVLLLLALVLAGSANEFRPSAPNIELNGWKHYKKNGAIQEKDFEFNLYSNLGKGKIVLTFFATWCGPCQKELPQIHGIMDDHKDTIFLAVSSKENPYKVKNFFKTKKLDNFGVLIDPSSGTLKDYRIKYYPTVIVINSSGNEIWRKTQPSMAELESVL